MQRFNSDIIGSQVLARRQKIIVGTVSETVIDPDDGKFAGLVIRGKIVSKAIAQKDIFGFGNKLIIINQIEDLGEIDDIVRIKKIRDQEVKIVKNKVYTVSGFYLGRVRDYTIDFLATKIARLYVNPRLLNRLTTELVINSTDIVSIKKEKITVRDPLVKEEEPIKTALKSKVPSIE